MDREDADRRGFARLAAGAAAAGAVVLLPTTAPAVDRGGAGGGAVPNLYPNVNARQFRQIQADENAHVDAITALIRSLGGTPRPKPTFRNLLQPNVKAFATVARTFTNTGAGAYTGAAPAILGRDVLKSAASIALIEGRHAGYVDHLLGFVTTVDVFGDENDFERPLTQKEVVTLAIPFYQSLNGGPPLAFNATPSRANDVAILNFALFLEYLEQEFYNLNVPKFFPA